MKLYRYEFDGRGMFTALDYLYDIDMEQNDFEDLKLAEDYFEKNLLAVTNTNLSKPFKFYFTLRGINKFKPYLDVITSLFDKYIDCKYGFVYIDMIDKPDDSKVLYKDKYQMVIKCKKY